MGAGKTTIGKLLADELALEFIDVDREIETRSGVDIPWIFDREGEPGFRIRESAALAELSLLDRVLISTGGGAVLSIENRQMMAATGAVIYLHTSVDEQVRRTGRDRKRPLLQNDDPARVLAELMLIREPLYRDVADIIVDTDGRGPKAVAQDIAEQLRAR
ncbi:MAG: shikimate kinase [Verrucomicrobiaceae bacterium]|nr:shikimate kinase [Verrucomicrobiaceae bacterium]